MIIIREKKSGVSIDRVCFYNGEKVKSNAQLIRYYRIPISFENSFGHSYIRKDYVYTLLNDISQSEENIFKSFKSNYRNEIRRQAKEVVNVDIYTANHLLDNSVNNVLEEFEKLHEEMLVEKDKGELIQNYDHSQIMSFITNNCFVLTRAESGDGGIVFHAYLCDGSTAILQHSCSDVRNGKVNKTSAGRLNKFLHWQDMLMFKQKGYNTYDWGNTFDEGPEYENGIDRFKAGFGGKSIKLVSIFVGNSLLGKAALYLRDMKTRGNKN